VQGRFASADPKQVGHDLEDPQGLNLYSYTRDNPLRYVDPDGEDWKDVVAGAFNGIHASFTYGATRSSGNSDFALGQQVGAKVAEGLGYIETAAGGLTAIGGGAACTTGVGCVITPEAVVAGVALAGHGLSVVASAQNQYNMASDEAPTSSGAEAPYENTPENQQRMREGKAPMGKDGKPVELHHEGQAAEGNLEEMTQSEHRLGDNLKKNHPDIGQQPSQIDRAKFRKQREHYWKNKAQEQEQ